MSGVLSHTPSARLILGDCLSVLPTLPPDSVDLIVTSPPYADARKATYGGISPDQYVSWFLPISDQLKRVLKPTGSFVLNLKEKVVNGERHTYVMELIIALRKQGWLWTEEYIWHKRNCYPGKWPNRFRDAWERCLHFTRERRFAMYQDEVRVPVGSWANTRIKASVVNDQYGLSDTESPFASGHFLKRAVDNVRSESAVDSGFGRRVANWVGRDTVYPTNVLHLAGETRNQSHSAAFPESLPSWFIRLFTKPGDTILDPFMGSGTSLVAATRLGRVGIGIDTKEEYVEVARRRLAALGDVTPRDETPSTPPTTVPDES